MQELIKYIADILNIKTESVYTVQDMTEELTKIKDIAAYRSFIRDHINSIDVDYKTGFQKFILLTQKYIEMENDAMYKLEAVQFAKTLLGKVKATREKVETENIAFSMINDSNGVQFFTEKELNALLNVFGGIKRTIEASRSDYFVHNIATRYVSRRAKDIKPYEELPQRLSGLMAKAITKG